jgi:hypothetical protein
VGTRTTRRHIPGQSSQTLNKDFHAKVEPFWASMGGEGGAVGKQACVI